MSKYIEQVRDLQSKPVVADPPSTIMGNAYRTLSACPFASRWCYAMCLNTSGHARAALTGPVASSYSALNRTIPPGITMDDDLTYLDIMGKSALLGGSINTTLQARHIHTFDLWLSWALYGVIRNPYYDEMFKEILNLQRLAVRKGFKGTAARFNGTSDYPFHLFELSTGENMMAALGRHGIVCYDYTKMYGRYDAWMKAKSWKGYEAGIAPAKIVKGFPSNYHLTFSFSEFNVERSIEVLRRGGNVAVAVRPVVGGRVLTPGEEYKKFTLPKKISIGALSMNSANKGLEATTIGGDFTDLRFMDPHTAGKKDAGSIVCLLAKGIRFENYKEQDRQSIMRRFIGKMDEGGNIINPSRPSHADKNTRAVVAADLGVVRNTGIAVGGVMIGTTGEGA